MRTSPDASSPPAEGGFLAPRPGSNPGDHCYRCGDPTPPGVGICARCNPGRVKGPSATQLHATILAGVILGAVALLVGWRFAVAQGGPYTATVVERSMDGDGAPAVTITVANTGERSGVANCRVTRDGSPRADDPTYRTERIEPGSSVTFARHIPAQPVDSPAYDLERISVLCT